MNERVKIPRHQIADLIELSGRPRNICEQRLAEGVSARSRIFSRIINLL